MIAMGQAATGHAAGMGMPGMGMMGGMGGGQMMGMHPYGMQMAGHGHGHGAGYGAAGGSGHSTAGCCSMLKVSPRWLHSLLLRPLRTHGLGPWAALHTPQQHCSRSEPSVAA